MQNIVKMDYEDVYKSFQQIDLQDSLKKKKRCDRDQQLAALWTFPSAVHSTHTVATVACTHLWLQFQSAKRPLCILHTSSTNSHKHTHTHTQYKQKQQLNYASWH